MPESPQRITGLAGCDYQKRGVSSLLEETGWAAGRRIGTHLRDVAEQDDFHPRGRAIKPQRLELAVHSLESRSRRGSGLRRAGREDAKVRRPGFEALPR